MEAKIMLKPIAVIDLYCGIGGFTQGAIEAGATVILSIDAWDEAVIVHKKNHPGIPCWNMKLGTESDWKLIKKVMDKYPNHHIHIHGSPPCQALSNASSTNSEKGMFLVNHFLEMIEKLNPDSWSMENVVPLKKKLPENIKSVILNSADFGVPQTRRRCYAGSGWLANPILSKDKWLSVLDVLPHLNDELLTHMDSGRSSSKTTGITPSTGKVGGGSGPLFRTLNDPSYTIMSSPKRLSRKITPTHIQGYSRTRPVMDKGKHTGVNTPRMPPDGWQTIMKPSYTVCSGPLNLWNINLNLDGAGKSDSRRAKSADVDINKPSLTIRNNRPTLRTIKLEALGSNSKRKQDRTILEPSKTICGSGNQVGPRIFNHINLNTAGSTNSIGAAAIAKDRTITKPSKVIRGHHVTLRDKQDHEKPVKIRSLTLSETLVLQGFSPDYDLSDANTMKSRWTMCGNAVPPAVGAAVIRGIHIG